jgi:hypothetical protein
MDDAVGSGPAELPLVWQIGSCSTLYSFNNIIVLSMNHDTATELAASRRHE